MRFRHCCGSRHSVKKREVKFIVFHSRQKCPREDEGLEVQLPHIYRRWVVRISDYDRDCLNYSLPLDWWVYNDRLNEVGFDSVSLSSIRILAASSW